MSDANSILILVFGTLLFTLFAVFTVLYIALQKKKQYRHHLEKQEMQHRFTKELMMSRLEVQEQTLKNLSAELHDNIAQLLGIAKMQILVLKNNADEEVKAGIAETAELIAEAIKGVRDMSHVMNGTYILKQGLKDSIEKDMHRIGVASRIKCIFTETGEHFNLGEDKELILFRIIQECVANAVKHAEPHSINVSLNYNADGLSVAVADDGKGFAIQAADGSAGLGLANVSERTALLRGILNIESEPGSGTKIAIWIPN